MVTAFYTGENRLFLLEKYPSYRLVTAFFGLGKFWQFLQNFPVCTKKFFSVEYFVTPVHPGISSMFTNIKFKKVRPKYNVLPIWFLGQNFGKFCQILTCTLQKFFRKFQICTNPKISKNRKTRESNCLSKIRSKKKFPFKMFFPLEGGLYVYMAH